MTSFGFLRSSNPKAVIARLQPGDPILRVISSIRAKLDQPARAACLAALAVSLLTASGAWAESAVDEGVRGQMLKHRDGPIAHVESQYNDLFVAKRGPMMMLSTRFKANFNIHSMINLTDPDDLPVPYTQLMTAGLLYPKATKRILMIGLGAGSVSTYLARAMPNAQIDVIELDPGVVSVAKQYFGVRETDHLHMIESDGRVYLARHNELYDLILLDAFRELGVPFHLLTKEFYTLVKEHLAPGGAVASNVTGGTRLYSSTLVTFRAVFPTVDVYPDFEDPDLAQVVTVAASSPEPSAEMLIERARLLQEDYRFRFPLPDIAKRRVVNRSAERGELLTDDFAPVNLYEITPLRRSRRP
jgi:spermidine synthase